MKRLLFPVIIGLSGLAVLLTLGIWQTQRLAWKTEILDRIEARVAAAPIPLPQIVTETEDEYRRVVANGRYTGEQIFVLTSIKMVGPGYRLIAAMTLDDGREILVDRGFVLEADKTTTRSEGAATITGSVLWPDEVDGFTPEPDLTKNIWFARDLPKMAEVAGTEQLLIVLETAPEGAPKPLPVQVNIPNDHLEYAITWFSLAAVWVVMTGYWGWRGRKAG